MSIDPTVQTANPTSETMRLPAGKQVEVFHFDAGPLGVELTILLSRIHGRLPDGTVISGVEVFRRLYSAIGFGWLVAPTRLPCVRWVLDFAYRQFARRRLSLTGRCETGTCRKQAESS